MKNLILTVGVSLISLFSLANLSIEGSYQGKNLYVQNPEDEDGFGFCATRVTVNGDVMPGSVNQSAFEINFAVYGLKKGDPVFIVIEHGPGCKPKILNPEVLLPRSTFEVAEITSSTNGLLKWTTTGEQGKLPFIIEQHRWNKWVNAGEVDGIGTPGSNSYEFKITPHSGENKVRVVQIDHSGKKRTSQEITFTDSSIPEIEFSPKKVKTIIKFDANGSAFETKYEIYDAYGNIVKKGVGTEVDCSNLKKGAYYINYDNKNEKFIRG
ncbi:hypothetical protein GCM10009118_33920 [Wandonia haliotis]|uniref:Secretion system C-terminal sorting domain-containing protein n=1 Tax=Wandonia haliotis TaxID=574963 RepID=A0ABP3Y7U5_9FLAO